MLIVGASRWQQRFAAPAPCSTGSPTKGCTAPAKSPLLCYCSSLSCVIRASLRAGEAVLKAGSSELFTRPQTSPFQRREQQGGRWPVPGSLSWDSELSCCVSGAKSGSVSSVCPGYHIKSSGTVRVNQQRVECIVEGGNDCAGDGYSPQVTGTWWLGDIRSGTFIWSP